MDEAGIFTSSCGFLGASPDGMVRGGEKIVELVEVKCPHRAHHGAVQEMCIVHLTAVCNQGWRISMNTSIHAYPSKIHTGNFIIWTSNDFAVETIFFFRKNCYPFL